MDVRRAAWVKVAIGVVALVATQFAARVEAAAQERAPSPLLPADFSREATAPQVAVGADGTVAAVFAVEDEVWCTVSRDGGLSFAAPARVGAHGKLERGMARGPKVAVTGDSIAVVAICGVELRGYDGDLLCWRSADRGATWSEPTRINDVAHSAREGLQALAAGPDGQLLCVWLDLRHVPPAGAQADEPAASRTELWGAWSDDGGATWSDDAPLYQSPDGTICECCAPAVTFDPSRGHAVVLWRNKLGAHRDMFAMLVKRGDESRVDRAMPVDPQHWELKACPMAGGGVAVSAEGTLLAFWRRESHLFATTPGLGVIGDVNAPDAADAVGAADAADPAGTVDAIGEGREAAVAAAPGGFQLLWTDAAGQVLTAFDAPSSGQREARALGRGYNSAVAGAPDGRGPVLAVWETGEPGPQALRVALLAERRTAPDK